VTNCLAKISTERTCRDDWTNARHDNRNGCQNLAAELAQPTTQSRVFDLDTGRPTDCLREPNLVIVRASNNGKVAAVHAELAYGLGGRRRGCTVGK
jgi:hypothetical protein